MHAPHTIVLSPALSSTINGLVEERKIVQAHEPAAVKLLAVHRAPALFHPHTNPASGALSTSVYRGHAGLGRLKDLPKVIQLGSHRAQKGTQVLERASPCSHHHPSQPSDPGLLLIKQQPEALT